MILLWVLFQFTKLGLAMRAAALRPAAAALVGVRVNWMLAIGWGLAAVLGAVAGLMTEPTQFLQPTMMQAAGGSRQVSAGLSGKRATEKIYFVPACISLTRRVDPWKIPAAQKKSGDQSRDGGHRNIFGHEKECEFHGRIFCMISGDQLGLRFREIERQAVRLRERRD